eukprot:TRINITY_DN15048_c0_g1_i1.p1 TRINITY_DN15048_c0_g1~~TRINITY_DN15048_c0_g1_i1.p1  ORF type:complete len:217 (-),score=29.80 TRINITY_DN15048_c0_g1_i1:172-822(-)
MSCITSSSLPSHHMSITFIFFFFFFQAEDGIRDAQESRGLGDVYKRQGINAEYGVNRAARIADVLVPEKVLRQLTGATPQAPVSQHGGQQQQDGHISKGYTAAEALYGSTNVNKPLDDFLLAPNGQPLLDFNGYDPDRAKREFWEKYRAQEQEARKEQEDNFRKEFTIPATREEASAMSVKHLKTLMWVNGLDWTGCVEKDDLINALMQSGTPTAT